jgi:hypothetical protein
VALELARVDFSEVTSGEGALELRSQLTIRAAHGEGVVLDRDGRPFHDALVHPADPADVAEWLETTPAPESHSLDRRAPAGARRAGHARCRRIRRHTFLCGQSGSGKTYSLGLALERLLVETDLRLVILDPNSDYVRLGEQRTDADAQLAAGFAEAATGVVVRSAGTGLQLGVGELDPSARAAALALDPVADREEFALVDEMLGARVAFEELAKIRRAARAGASPPSREPRRSALGAVGPRPAWVARRRCRASRCPLSRRRSRLPVDPRGASRRRGGRARNALAAAGRSRARPRRDR